jgi:tetratricopeptide (TPR) repeat protein
MAGQNERSALAALDAARPVIARLDGSRHPEDLAADIIESWSAVETALRSLVGGSSLSGQALVREARGRQLLTLEQANSLVQFQAARDRASRTDYKPNASDAASARAGYLSLESGLMSALNPAPVSPALTPRSAPTTPLPSGESFAPASRFRRGPWRTGAGILGLLIVGAVAWWAIIGRSSDSGTADGVRLLNQGKREVARDVFKKAARDNPRSALPLVYIGRMYRDEQRYDSARVYLEAAIRRDPNSGPAFRELAKLLFLQGNYDGARTFFVRAAQADASDKEALGYLGCTLIRMGRVQEGQNFIRRAGPGQWEACAVPLAPGGVPQGVPPA